MCSKLINPTFSLSRLACGPRVVLVPRSAARAGAPLRAVGHLVPPTQYDMAIPKRMEFYHVITNYWELIPVFGVTFFSGLLLVLAIVWACRNKVRRSQETDSKLLSRAWAFPMLLQPMILHPLFRCGR